MGETVLFLPIVIVLLGALAAVGVGLSPLRARVGMVPLSWGLALFPLAAFALLATAWPALVDGQVLQWEVAWLPAVNLPFALMLDSLGALFAFLVSGIGVLVVIYGGYYFKGDATAWRFQAYLLLFMASMLGLVMAGDVLSLFIFWEGTSIVSYLLVAYKYKYEEARAGAFRALFITGGGGIALLAGLLLVSYVAGGSDFATILQSGEALRGSGLYGVMLGLVAFGAFTKSAQFPAHIWLPGAMSAPTPASAYLHSATMVKAGIFLLARLNPALGGTEAWFWLLTIVGGLTMLAGAYLGLKQNDLKALLAYSTISQLGVFVMMIGQEMDLAFKALVVGVLAHALYKSALFMVAGIVDHETGTRDIRRLGGLRRAMPATFALGAVTALSMAGLPPLFGFLAKETLLAAAVHPTFAVWESYVLAGAAVAAGALLLAQSGLLVYETFLGRPKDATVQAHEAPWGMLLAPALPAVLSLAIGLLPDTAVLEAFLAKAAGAAFGGTVKVSLALWTGVNLPLGLSVVAITLGTILFVGREVVRAWQQRIGAGLTFNAVYAGVLAGIDRLAWLATRLQLGRLRVYLSVMLLSMVGLVLLLGGVPWPALDAVTWPTLDFAGELAALRVFALLVIVGAGLATVLLKRDFAAIVALGALGLAVAVLMALEPAPDVALVQVVVDILSLVILVLALTRLPRSQRRRAQQFTFAQSRGGLLRDAVVAGLVGVVVTAVTFGALTSRPRASVVTPFFEANAKPLTGAKDIVGAIIVDFRALDTLIEIAVFGMAGLGIYTLLRYAVQKHGDSGRQLDDLPAPLWTRPTRGIGGLETSAFVHGLAYLALPLALVLAATHMMYGHDQPGDGFTAGVILSLAVGFWYVVFGYYGTRARLGWLRPAPLIGSGLLLVVGSGLAGLLVNGQFLSPVDFGKMIGLPLPAGLYLSTSFLFEVAICLAVLGSATYMLNTLGHPEQRMETDKRMEADKRMEEPASLPAGTRENGAPAGEQVRQEMG
ncbi:MAG: DUF4040 domain-containing protein [Anaerolineales bacterium]|nr:DUF4040 domain-containing protein [Anaerolineales bacterium]